MAKTFVKQAAQGELLFIRVNKLPENVKEAPREKDGTLIVGHSETNHHHVFLKDSGVTMFTTENPLVAYLRVDALAPSGGGADLVHLRSYDTHDSVRFEPGIYRVNHQREWTPAGWQRVAD